LSRFLWHARLGPTGKELLLQLPLPGCRFARLPDELRRLPLHVLLRLQHEVLHVYRLLPLQSAKLLQEVGMLQQHLLPAEQLVLLHLQLLHVRPLWPLLLQLLRNGRGGLVGEFLPAEGVRVALRSHCCCRPWVSFQGQTACERQWDLSSVKVISLPACFSSEYFYLIFIK
jgi:hypothetical protein